MYKHINFAGLLFLVILYFGFSNEFLAQDEVRQSPKASVSQVVGLTEVEIVYSRPGVKKRTIWGDLVPFDKVWRAGANEATKISFSTDVKIEGKNLPSGTYSLFAIPNKNEWILIFNKVADQWGAFEYNESEDALRINVKPEKGNMQEWLVYTITKTGNNSAVVALEWENLRVPFDLQAEAGK
jgi:hypothetical protein